MLLALKRALAVRVVYGGGGGDELHVLKSRLADGDLAAAGDLKGRVAHPHCRAGNGRVGGPAAGELDEEGLDDDLAPARLDGEARVLVQAAAVKVVPAAVKCAIVRVAYGAACGGGCGRVHRVGAARAGGGAGKGDDVMVGLFLMKSSAEVVVWSQSD